MFPEALHLNQSQNGGIRNNDTNGGRDATGHEPHSLKWEATSLSVAATCSFKMVILCSAARQLLVLGNAKWQLDWVVVGRELKNMKHALSLFSYS